MSVNLHIADHRSAWQPDDEHQERSSGFQRYNQHDLDVPAHGELISRFHTLVERHPKTTFVAVNFSNLGHNLAQLGRALDRFPNLNVDLSARAYEFGRQPFTAPAFFAKYKDRILYGSDQEVTPEMCGRGGAFSRPATSTSEVRPVGSSTAWGFPTMCWKPFIAAT